jgi:hypothetical protein
MAHGDVRRRLAAADGSLPPFLESVACRFSARIGPAGNYANGAGRNRRDLDFVAGYKFRLVNARNTQKKTMERRARVSQYKLLIGLGYQVMFHKFWEDSEIQARCLLGVWGDKAGRQG